MQGDVTLILENIMLSENDDLPRFIETYENLIKEKKLKRCKAFDISKKKVKLLEEPNEEEQIEIAASLSSLKSQIAIRNQSRAEELFAALEAKYAVPKNKSSKAPDKKKKKTDNRKHVIATEDEEEPVKATGGKKLKKK